MKDGVMQPELDETPNRSFDGIAVLSYLLRYKWFITIITLIGTGVSVGVTLYMKNYYSATVSAVPPKKSSTGLDAAISSVSSTLREFGLTKVGGKRGEGYDFMVLLSSRQVKDSIIKKFDLQHVYELDNDTSIHATRSILESNMAINVEAEGNYTITVEDTDPHRAAQMANYSVEIANVVAQSIERRESQTIFKQFEDRIAANDAMMKLLADSIALYTKQSMVYAPLEQAKAAATALGELKGELIKQEILLSTVEKTYGENDPIAIRQRDVISTLRAKVSDAENRPGYIGDFPLRDAPAAAYPYLRLYSQLEALMKVKAFLLPSFEQVKLDLIKEAPALYVLDEAQPPHKKSRPKRSLIVGGAMLGTFMLSVVMLIILLQIRRLRRIYADYHLKQAEASNTASSM